MKKFIVIFLTFLFVPLSASAETLDEKVARNTANCLAGHVATNSSMYQSGETSKYLAVLEKAVGSENTAKYFEDAVKKLKSAVRMLGSTPAEEGAFLIKKFCPAVDQIINRGK
ncbi:hypothetical protein ACMZOO_00920 [Catenovulum sp. SX2]|uniref:hypothetical protein n=1 Tax=Catenovulum sp. SX2 TaxID=3398614 RepID=UPI003F855705